MLPAAWMHTEDMLPVSERTVSAISAHRFLMRAALAATAAFSWIFILQYFYITHENLGEAFARTIMLYALAQVATLLLTPYSAMQLIHGVRKRLLAGTVICMLSFSVLSLALAGVVPELVGLLAFALFYGAYRAFYWTPYVLERSDAERSGLVHEFFIALMPAIAGLALYDGLFGATVLLLAGASIFLASLAPLMYVPEIFERFSWGYRQTFGELFEKKYDGIVETAFLEGILGTSLLLLWPLAIFILVGLSYISFGLVLTATLLLSVLIKPFGMKYLERRVLLHATLAATSWLFRLVVATPLGVIFVDAYSSAGRRSGEYLTLEHSADNGTYLDEYTVLKEISMCLGSVFMCITTVICISAFTLPVGLAVSFVIAAAASVIAVVHSRKEVVVF